MTRPPAGLQYPAGLALAVLLLAACEGGHFEERVPLPPGAELVIDLDFGDGFRPDRGHLELRPHDAPEVWVSVEAEGFGSSDVKTRLEPGRERVHLAVRVEGATSWMFGGPNVRVRVEAPAHARVDARSRGGELRVEDLQGGLRARVRDAGIELRGVSGPVKLRAVNGAVEVQELRGDLEVSSSDGSIEAAWVEGDVEVRTTEGAIALHHVSGRVDARTLEGGIDVEAAGGPVRARSGGGAVQVAFDGEPAGTLESEDGDVVVRLPEGAGTELDARANRGGVDVAAGLRLRGDIGEGHAHGSIGGGGPLLVLRSSEGRIRVGRR